jgi:hypothetical protein
MAEALLLRYQVASKAVIIQEEALRKKGAMRALPFVPNIC